MSDEKRRNNDRGNEKCGAKLTSVFGSDPASALKYAVHKIAGAPDAARREAAEYYDVSASTAVIWVKCFRETGRCSAKPRGGSTSPLEDEVICAMRKCKIRGSRTAVWRFFQRHKSTFKKSPARGGAGTRRRGARSAALDARTGVV